MFRLLRQSLLTGNATCPRSDLEKPAPAVYFGFPKIDFARCTACADCAEACPTGALAVQGVGTGSRMVTLSRALCTGCRECVAACPEQAVTGSGEFALVAFRREQLITRARFDEKPGEAVSVFGGVEELEGPSLKESAGLLRQRIRGRFGRSLQVRQVDAGSCNGCELEIAATSNPVFDLERFGVHLVASPRHADALLVTGPVTRNMEIALLRTYEATPEPRIVVAVGTCGCSGGIFGEGTYASVGGVDRVIPVDLYVPGCPPRPHAIALALLTAMDSRLSPTIS
jgi:Ni,Fe-hydrogenase III small subunit/formate hydrogenlyase subunit 6/NADH:ubiquinone oxidoreductase subunit I